MTRRRGVAGLAWMTALVALLSACGGGEPVRHDRPRPVYGPRGSAPPVRVSQPRYGATYVVQRGDNVYRIATNNGITALDLALWNNIAPPYTIYPGQRLNLYPGGPRRAASGASAARPATAPAPRTPAAPAPVVAPATAPFAWTWPARGPVLGGFASGDPTRQGVDIGGTAGDPVRAAADGVVVYSGSGLVGYGELVIVKHNEQWLSAYGHNRARLVSEGQAVKGGQQIAEMGRSGADRDMLHFEIRYAGKPVDPQAYLPRR